jgi:hypothetical protein
MPAPTSMHRAMTYSPRRITASSRKSRTAANPAPAPKYSPTTVGTAWMARPAGSAPSRHARQLGRERGAQWYSRAKTRIEPSVLTTTSSEPGSVLRT